MKLRLYYLVIFIGFFVFYYELKLVNLPNKSKIVDESHDIVSNDDENDKKPKVLCLILTTDDDVTTRSIPVYKTWAQKCNKALFACDCSNFTKILRSEGSRNYFKTEQEYQNALKLPILQLNMKEDYSKMAEKVMKVLRTAYDEYLDKFDWFLLTDDDTFIFVDHLYQFISNLSPKDPLTYGYNFKTVIPTGYHSGGGGTLITHESLRRMGINIHKGNVIGCNETMGYMILN
jgi:hypothetical protein